MTSALDADLDPGELLRDEVIHWFNLLNLMAYAAIPLRTRAEGLECITSVLMKQRAANNGPFLRWLPVVLSASAKQQLLARLKALPHLAHPVSESTAQSFIEQWMSLNDWPGWIPKILTSLDIEYDDWCRREYVTSMGFFLKEQIRKKQLPILNAGLSATEEIPDNVYLERKHAIVLLMKFSLYEQVKRMASAAPPVILPRINFRDHSEFEPKKNFPGLLGVSIYLRDSGELSSHREALNDDGHLAAFAGGLKALPASLATADASLLEQPNRTLMSENEPPLSIDQSLMESRKDAPAINAIEAPIATTKLENHGTHGSSVVALKVLKIKDVMERTGLSKSTLYNFSNEKSKYFDSAFPKRRQLTEHSVGYIESEIDEWIKTRS